jgi:ferrochelatase
LAPTAEALKPYLKQFLGDYRVIEKNRLLWWFVLNCIILRTRPARSARLYKRIWTDEGSPLLVHTKRQTELLRERFSRSHPSLVIRFGMRYGEPSLESAIDELLKEGCARILLFPMYPQYSATTTGSTYDAVFARLLRERFVPTLKVVAPYYADSGYLDALAATINEAYAPLKEAPQRLVLSYHGIPEAYVGRGDPYCCMCTETTMGLISRLKIPKEEIIHTYQSRFGRDPWLEPYTDQTIERLARNGIKRIAVACPGFPADCLETLDELGNEGREKFIELGGVRFTLIPCLNEHPGWIDAMEKLIKDEIGNWVSGGERGTHRFRCPVQAAKGAATPPDAAELMLKQR